MASGRVLASLLDSVDMVLAEAGAGWHYCLRYCYVEQLIVAVVVEASAGLLQIFRRSREMVVA